MSPKKPMQALAITAAGIIVTLLVLWGICIACDYLENPPNNTAKAPDYSYSYNLLENGTIRDVIIDAHFTFYFRNDVRFLETAGDNLEVKLWGKYMMPSVTFHKADDLLIVDIGAQSMVDNFLGSKRASEYIYLPKNWSYSITSTNEQGDTYIENKSWKYEPGGEPNIPYASSPYQ